jgi:choline monooxygenase
MKSDWKSLPDFTEKDLEIIPLERAETIPSSWYVHPGFLNLEKELVFNHCWQLVGHACKAPNPGDHFVSTVVGNPVIVVRGTDGILRAFFNVCRHRGGPLAIEDGHAKALQCKYHGWTYTLDGFLRGVPKFDRSELFDKKDFGLIPLRLESWDGLLFVNMSSDPVSLATVMKGVREKITPTSLSSLMFFKRVDYTVRCNWKVYIDNYLEGYHVPLVHPDLTNILDYQKYVTETAGHYSVQYSPLSEDEHSYGIQRGGTAYYFQFFPNFMLNVLPGRMQTNVVLPISVDETLVRFEYYYEEISDTLRQKIEEDINCSDHIQQEDIGICEHVQKGLESVAYDRGRFSPEMEEAVHHFQAMLKTAFRKALEGS